MFETKWVRMPRADPEGGQVVQTPPTPKNYKNIGFLTCNKTDPDPLKNHKAAKPAFNNGPSMVTLTWYCIVAKWRFAGGPMMARNKWYLDPLIN